MNGTKLNDVTEFILQKMTPTVKLLNNFSYLLSSFQILSQLFPPGAVQKHGSPQPQGTS